MKKKDVVREKVVLAGLLTPYMDRALFEEDMHEMRQLCETAGGEVVASFTQRRDRVATGTYLGWGKLKEISGLMKTSGATTLIIDAHLAPGQVRTIEKSIRGKVVDRGQLILDIFALHARTAEARLQVELAQMRMLYPRLTHAWSHFSEQFGGIGTRGPGEKQLEIDRRLVQRKITDLKRKLAKIEKGHSIQRRGRSAVFKAALIGYTNVGKSSLLNGLCGSSVFVEDKLFATLDTSTRRAYIPEAGTIIISDTVGMLRNLPHHLVASFRSTLSEAAEAQLLLLVMDASSSWIEQQMRTVEQVLVDLKADSIARMVLFNKIDLVKDPFVRKRLLISWPDALFVSALCKDDIRVIREAIAEAVRHFRSERRKDDLISRTTKTYLREEQ